MEQTTETTASALRQAIDSGSYMVAVWRIEGGKLNLFRKTEAFPVVEFNKAIEMLEADLKNKETNG